MTDVLVLLVVLALTAGVALWHRSREGRVSGVAGEAFDRARLGAPAGVRLLVEFTAPTCASCGAAKDVLDAVARDRADVLVVTVDVGDHLDLARAHSIMRAPTTLVVDEADRVRHRISGVPTSGDVVAVLDGRRAQAA
jgi:thioredoxin-like negative regulator of GroEL